MDTLVKKLKKLKKEGKKGLSTLFTIPGIILSCIGKISLIVCFLLRSLTKLYIY